MGRQAPSNDEIGAVLLAQDSFPVNLHCGFWIFFSLYSDATQDIRNWPFVVDIVDIRPIHQYI